MLRPKTSDRTASRRDGSDSEKVKFLVGNYNFIVLCYNGICYLLCRGLWLVIAPHCFVVDRGERQGVLLFRYIRLPYEWRWCFGDLLNLESASLWQFQIVMRSLQNSFI